MTTLTKKKTAKKKPSRSSLTNGIRRGNEVIDVRITDVVEEKVIRLDLGCGKNKRQDGEWIGIDELDFEGVDIVMNLAKEKWPFKDESVTEVYASHFVEHLEPNERVHFVNELYRVLKKPQHENGQQTVGKATIITPHWASQRAYGDLTHKWPPVSEFWFYYLDKDWRAVNAPHNQFYTCDFQVSWGYSEHPELNGRNIEYKQQALKFWKEACSDTIAYFVKKG